ncbi:MAG: hypothetical protein CL471_14805 [Acidobacteria bacterium]|nr:hypothetical protein [Acidobacteriota bacterium]
MSLDDQIREATEALTRQLRERFDAEVAGAVERTRTEGEQRLAHAVATSRADAEHRLEAAVAAAKAELEEKLTSERAAGRAEAEAKVGEELSAARAESARLADAARAKPAAADVASAVAAARADAKQVLERQIEASRVEAERHLEAEVARLKAQHEVALERAAAQSQNDIDRRVAEAVEATREQDSSDVSPMWTDAGETEGSVADTGPSAQAVRRRSLEAFRRLDGASSLSTLLDALLTAIGADVARAALVVDVDGRLQGWGADGFGESVGDPRRLELDGVRSGILGAAMADRQSISWASNGDADPERAAMLPAFAQLPEGGAAVAVPLVVGGRSVAAVYADDGGSSDRAAASGWVEAVELLTAHASRCAESMTATRLVELIGASVGDVAAGAEVESASDGADAQIEAARRYARLMVSEIKLYNEEAVRAGREHCDLAERLRDEIANARESFEARVPASLATRDEVFTDEVVRTLADGDAKLLGGASSDAS